MFVTTKILSTEYDSILYSVLSSATAGNAPATISLAHDQFILSSSGEQSHVRTVFISESEFS